MSEINARWVWEALAWLGLAWLRKLPFAAQGILDDRPGLVQSIAVEFLLEIRSFSAKGARSRLVEAVVRARQFVIDGVLGVFCHRPAGFLQALMLSPLVGIAIKNVYGRCAAVGIRTFSLGARIKGKNERWRRVGKALA